MSKHLSHRSANSFLQASLQCERVARLQRCALAIHTFQRYAPASLKTCTFHQRRPFSYGSKLSANMRIHRPKTAAQPSLQSQRKEAMAEQLATGGGVAEDQGPVENTFVTPKKFPWLPPHPSDTRPWFKFMKAFVHCKALDLFTLIKFKLIDVKPRPDLEIKALPAIAERLHREVFTAFAEGDVHKVQSQACPGLLAALQRRIESRAPGIFMKWEVKHLSVPKVVSYKAACAPTPKDQNEGPTKRTGMKQAVVRIHSRQSLQRIMRQTRGSNRNRATKDYLLDGMGKAISEDDEAAMSQALRAAEKDTVENFVIQKMLVNGKEHEWKIWGTIPETTIESINKNV